MKRKMLCLSALLSLFAGVASGQETEVKPSDFDGPAAVFIKNPGVLTAIDFAASVPADTIYAEFEKGELLPFVLTDTAYVSVYNYAADETFVYDTIRVYSRKPENIVRLGNNGGWFTSIDISKLTGLEWLNFEHNYLESIDVSHNPELQMLYLDDNMGISTLDVTHNPKLELLDVEMLALTELDVSQNKNLMHLGIGYTDIAEINLDSNRNLYELLVTSTPMTELNTSIFPNLQYLSVSYSHISELDLTKNPKLFQLYAEGMRGEPIEYIDVTQCPELQIFFASMNALEKVDFSNNPKLKSIYVYANQLRELDISNNPDVIELICWDNYLTYATLPHREINYYTALPQNEMAIAERYEAGEKIDFSAQLMVDETRTSYEWKTGDEYPYVTLLEGVDYEIENGVTRFLRAQPDPVFCEMNNAFFGELSLTTSRTTIWSEDMASEESGKPAFQLAAKDGKLQIKMAAAMQVEVFDVKGVRVFGAETLCGIREISVPCSGMYLVRLSHLGRAWTEKVMVY